MEILGNLDLLSVGIVVAATGVLGFSVYFSNKKSVTNQAFLFFSIMTAIWGSLTFAEYHVEPGYGLLLLRFSLFFAVWQAYSIYLFFLAFPVEQFEFRPSHRYILFPVVATTALITTTPHVLSRVTQVTSEGTIAAIENGPAIWLFGIVSVSLIAYGLWIFLRKMRIVRGADRRPYVEIQIGTFLTFALIITFNFILPAFLGNSYFVGFGSVFMFPFIIFASYAILREHLFNIKTLATSILVFILAVVSFGEIIFSNTLSLMIFRTSIFMLVLISGISLIRGVLREIWLREDIEKLARELQVTNERQEGLIHFIGHEVKGSLTKDEGAFAELVDGDFGALPDPAKQFAERALAEARGGVEAVSNILKASNLKKGTVAYTNERFDLKPLVADAVARAKPVAEQKGLALSFEASDDVYEIMGDKTQISDHVLRNLIDNAVNYTPTGSIVVSLSHESGKVVFSVQDTGIGITDEDKKKLFTEGGHGAESQKVNAHSTGYGLYIAKQITEAQGGIIRAESDGPGKGSRFVAEWPAA